MFTSPLTHGNRELWFATILTQHGALFHSVVTGLMTALPGLKFGTVVDVLLTDPHLLGEMAEVLAAAESKAGYFEDLTDLLSGALLRAAYK